MLTRNQNNSTRLTGDVDTHRRHCSFPNFTRLLPSLPARRFGSTVCRSESAKDDGCARPAAKCT